MNRIADNPLVDACPLVQGLIPDIRYATDNNIFGRAVYPIALLALRHQEALRLNRVAQDLLQQGFRLIGYDGYRPLSVQDLLWQLMPVAGYVAPPDRGSNHNRGTAVDVGLADLAGKPVAMPSSYDEFSPSSHHDFGDCHQDARHHRQVLLQAMERQGFGRNSKEWWHYDAPNASHWPIEDMPLEKIAAVEAEKRGKK